MGAFAKEKPKNIEKNDFFDRIFEDYKKMKDESKPEHVLEKLKFVEKKFKKVIPSDKNDFADKVFEDYKNMGKKLWK